MYIKGHYIDHYTLPYDWHCLHTSNCFFHSRLAIRPTCV